MVVLQILSSIIVVSILIYFGVFFHHKDNHSEIYRDYGKNSDINTDGERLVFTMTTIPSRLGYVHTVVENLLSLSTKPDVVYLNLPSFSVRENCEYIIPERLEKLRDSDSRFIINTGVFDHGPATKLIPILDLECEPDTFIIPVDDDAEFPTKYFEELIEYSRRFPNTVFGYHGVKVFDKKWHVVQTDVVDNVDIVETSAGAIYRRKMFKNNLHIHAEHPCRLQDDFIFGNEVGANGFSRALLPSDKDRVSTKGRKGMPMTHKFDMPNPLYMVNFHKEGNSNCSTLLSDSFRRNKIYTIN